MHHRKMVSQGALGTSYGLELQRDVAGSERLWRQKSQYMDSGSHGKKESELSEEGTHLEVDRLMGGGGDK